jgi:CheY-like chemotaxis protein
MTVLIVEDNAGVRQLLRSAVAEVAADVRECSDGADVPAAYTAHQPDVVLMDVRMPGMDAGACAYVLKQNLLDLVRLLRSVVE